MKVVYQTCCGVDVHKSFLVATIIKTTYGVEPSYQKKRFSTFNNSILKFKNWLIENQCRDVCMESTGKYWVPVFNLFGGRYQRHDCQPQMGKSSQRKQGRYERFQMDRGSVSIRSGTRELYPL